MENNELKDKILKNVKENIAISNIRKEINMDKAKNKKILYGILSSCAMLMICAVAIFNSKIKVSENNCGNIANGISDKYISVEDLQAKEKLDIELNINKIAEIKATMLDADIKTSNNISIPAFGFLTEIQIPSNFDKNNISAIFIKEENSTEYNILNNYVLNYYNNQNSQNIILAFSDKYKPLRDYYIDSNSKKISKIGDAELKISQYKEMYIVEFYYKEVYFDIETNGITEKELLDLLTSIITGLKQYGYLYTPIEDKDVSVNEQPAENINTDYPDYYAGKYIDNSGNNVVLLCEDNETNRKQICSLLKITKSKTKFKEAKYSYNYLTELQSKISKGMQNKELTFVVYSALMEDNNNIKVTVTSNNESDLNKLKILDTVGGAIDIQHSSANSIKEDLLIKTE